MTDYPMVATPNPAPSCDGNGLSMTDVAWGDVGRVDVRINAADGPLFASAGSAGSQETGKWVNDGMKLFLVEGGTGNVLQEMAVDNTVFRMRQQSSRCLPGRACH